ncbi:MAG: CPCC family cysteine-rich protein [Lachnospiraceae bacterium]
MQKRYRCPCCGYFTFTEKQGSYDICPVCYWEDDAIQRENPDYAGGANHLSLNECRSNYRTIGACEEKFLQCVRKPLPEEMKDGK